jgi:hypothetical protein
MAREQENKKTEEITLSLNQVREMKEKLLNLKEHVPYIDGTTCDFAAFLADRFPDGTEIAPMDFLITYKLALSDLESGIDGDTQEPIDRKYAIARLPRENVRLLNLTLLTIVSAVTPQEYASRVKEVDDSIKDRERKNRVEVYGEEGIPEVKIPGIDPFKIFKETGKLPSKGILLRAEFVFKGNGVFTIYEYNNIEGVSISEQGENKENQYLHVSFRWDENSRQLCLGYEHPDYPYKTQQPHGRSIGSYMPYSFADFDVVELPPLEFLNHAPTGRLLILKSALRLGNLGTRLDQHPIYDTLWGKHGLAVRLFEPGNFEGVAEAIKVITRDLIRLDPNAAEVIKVEVIKRLSQKVEQEPSK